MKKRVHFTSEFFAWIDNCVVLQFYPKFKYCSRNWKEGKKEGQIRQKQIIPNSGIRFCGQM